MIKRIKYISFHKENQLSAFLKSRGCNGEQLSKYDVTDWPTSFFYRGKRSTLFCCRGRIEIKYRYLLSWLLQNNLLGVEMLFEIQFLFKTTFLHLGGYSATNTITRALFLKYTKSTINWLVKMQILRNLVNPYPRLNLKVIK